MENKEIDVRNRNDEELLEVYGLIAQKTNLVHNRLKELFEEDNPNRDEEELKEEDLTE